MREIQTNSSIKINAKTSSPRWVCPLGQNRYFFIFRPNCFAIHLPDWRLLALHSSSFCFVQEMSSCNGRHESRHNSRLHFPPSVIRKTKYFSKQALITSELRCHFGISNQTFTVLISLSPSNCVFLVPEIAYHLNTNIMNI